MKLSEYHSKGINTFVPAPEYSPFDWFFIGLGVGLPVVGDMACDAYFIIKDVMTNDNDALLVDFGLALIPFISTGHVKAANRVMNAMESSADAGKGVRRTAGSVSDLENILHSNRAAVKRGESFSVELTQDMDIYRVFGGKSRNAFGRSWTPYHPEGFSKEAFSMVAGLPGGNSMDLYAKVTLKKGSVIDIKAAKRFEPLNRPGGLLEINPNLRDLPNAVQVHFYAP